MITKKEPSQRHDPKELAGPCQMNLRMSLRRAGGHESGTIDRCVSSVGPKLTWSSSRAVAGAMLHGIS
jgi:hypothetical protein